jgi:hypothetical protein
MESETGRVHAHHHAVQFYGTESSLFTTVAGFLSEGLIAGQPALVIATEPHRAGVLEQLSARLIDVEQALRVGDLAVLDAREVLDRFMVNDRPEPAVFAREVGALIERQLRGRTRTVVRAYGEMVDVLWKDGNSDAAITLEILWNKLAATYGFALLCGYSMGNFYKQVEQFHEVCRQHTQVVAPGDNVAVFSGHRTAKLA